MRKWTVNHGKDGFGIAVVDVPRWVDTVEQVGMRTLFPLADKIAAPEWTWKVPIGRKRIDEDDPDWIVNSVADLAWTIGQWPALFAWRRSTRIVELEIDDETARLLEPAFYEQCIAIWADDEDELVDVP